MKKTLAIVLCMSMLLGMLSMLSFADTTTVVEMGSEWSYLVYEDVATEAPEGWTTAEDSESWETAPAPFSGTAYTNGAAVTVFPYGNYRCYMRQTFTLAADATSVTLNIKYDEEPVIYINGTEVWDWTDYDANKNYMDHTYIEIDLSAYADAFKAGENVIAVDWRNAFGGSVMDMELIVTTGDAPVEPPVVDDSLINEDGTVKIETTDSFGQDGNPATCPFGDIGGVANLYDGNQNSVWGWGSAGSVIATFKGEVNVTEIYLSTKDEGSMTGDTAPHGEYVVSFLVDGEWFELGVVQALIEGNTVQVENIKATAVKVEIKDWYNDNWRCIAELTVKGEEIVEEPDVTPEPTPDVPPTEEEPPVDTGDATVYAIVFAVVALMGMAVVVTKKVRA